MRAVLATALLAGTAASCALAAGAASAEESNAAPQRVEAPTATPRAYPPRHKPAFELRVTGGVSGAGDYSYRDIVDNKVSTEFDPGWFAEAGFGARFGKASFEAAFDYAHHDGQLTYQYADSYIAPVVEDISHSTFAFAVNGRYEFAQGALSPYVGGGFGAAAVWSDADFYDQDVGAGLLVQGLAGVRVRLAPKTALFVEGRARWIGPVAVETQVCSGSCDKRTSYFDFTTADLAAGLRFDF
jgi:opacity protein-like surface antigen